MNKKKVIIGIAVTVVIIGLLVYWAKVNERKSKNETQKDASQVVVEDRPVSTGEIDIKNQIYSIDDREVELKDGQGVSSVAEGSATVAKTTILSGPAFVDLDLDGVKDAVVVLRDEPGGSGLFYHSAVVLSNNGQTQTTNSVFLGDRIRIKSISVDSGTISIVVLERKSNEPFSVVPSTEKTFRLKVNKNTLVVVEN